MTKIDFSQPRRQSVRGLILIFFQESKRGIKMFWPIIVPVLVKQSDKKMLLIGLILLAGLILTLIHSILYFRKFKFHIENKQFILKKGYLNHKILAIPLDRIQNVNTNQTVVQQFLDVMSLEIDTAGSAKKELKIHALSKIMAAQLALELSSYLDVQGDDQHADDKSVISEEKQILKLTNWDLLKIGLSQNHVRTALIVFLFSIQFYSQVREFFEERAKEYAHEVLLYLSQSGWAMISSLILLFVLISFLYSMIRTLVLFYDLRLLKMNQAYRIVSGLLNRKNLLIPFRKIQQLERVYFRRTWLYFGWLPAGLLSPALFLDWRYIFVVISWILFMFLYSHLVLRKSYFQISNDQIRVSSGAISHKFKQMEFHKVQHVEFSQSLFNKKRGVASLKIGNASGFIMIPFIDEKIARKLHDYLLYYAETSDNVWM
ncbi:MAG: PH domain-containing protein [Bacteroidia bacterium]|nr:PH domain-containing protein [Bacteroidia bacterium]